MIWFWHGTLAQKIHQITHREMVASVKEDGKEVKRWKRKRNRQIEREINIASSQSQFMYAAYSRSNEKMKEKNAIQIKRSKRDTASGERRKKLVVSYRKQ